VQLRYDELLGFKNLLKLEQQQLQSAICCNVSSGADRACY